MGWSKRSLSALSISQLLCLGSLLRDGPVNKRQGDDRLRATVPRGPRVSTHLPQYITDQRTSQHCSEIFLVFNVISVL